MKKQKFLEPIPPGEILLEDFIKPFNLSINGLAKAIDVPPGRISDIVNGKRALTADTALRLGRFFGYPLKYGQTSSRISSLELLSKSTVLK